MPALADWPPGVGVLLDMSVSAEANHHDVDRLFPRLVAAHEFGDAGDIAAVLPVRLAQANARPAGSGRARKTPPLIVGRLPEAAGLMADDMRHAHTERQDLIAERVDAVLDTALTGQEPWIARSARCRPSRDCVQTGAGPHCD